MTNREWNERLKQLEADVEKVFAPIREALQQVQASSVTIAKALARIYQP